MWGGSLHTPLTLPSGCEWVHDLSLGDVHPSESTNLPPSPQLRGRIDGGQGCRS